MKKLIERMNLSLGEFAKQCRVTASSLSLFLSHKREATAIIRRRMMAILEKTYEKIEWDDIFYFEESEEQQQEQEQEQQKIEIGTPSGKKVDRNLLGNNFEEEE
jgi:transcriptional regulator with XRE-family HTH domain